MGYTTRLAYEPLRSIDSATFTGSYQLLGSSLSNSSSLIKIVNNSNVDVTVSTDGTNDHDFVPANGFVLYDNTTNHTTDVPGVFVPQGRQYFVKGSAGTGSVYLITQYIVKG